MPNPTAAMLVIGDEILSGRTRDSNTHHLAGALTAITAAVLGVIANLALWFAVNLLFAHSVRIDDFGLALLVPEPSSLRPRVLGLSALALLLVFGAVALAAARLGKWLARAPGAQALLNRVAALIFVALAARLALASR